LALYAVKSFEPPRFAEGAKKHISKASFLLKNNLQASRI